MKKNNGQALVEFILVLPVLLLILLGIVDFSNIIFIHINNHNTFWRNISLSTNFCKNISHDYSNCFASRKKWL